MSIFTAENISGAAIVFFSLLGAWSLFKQAQKIWRAKSGKSVSVTWMIYMCFLYVVSFIYAIEIKSWPMGFHAVVRCLAHVPVLIGLWKFKGYTKKEDTVLAGMFIICAGMIILPYKGVLFLCISLGAIAASMAQPIEIIREKKTGVLDVRVLIIYFLSNLFWVIYAFAVRDWALEIMSLVFLAAIIFILGVWWKYRK